MSCGVINQDGSITITHPDINIYEVMNMIQDIQKDEGNDVETCTQELLNTFTGNIVKSDDDLGI